MPEVDSQHPEGEQAQKNPFTGAEAYKNMVGEPAQDKQVEDPAKAEEMAYAAKSKMDNAVGMEPHVNMRHAANAERLQADRLADGVGAQYDKTQAGETEGPNVVEDIGKAEAMAHAANRLASRAADVRDKLDHIASQNSENATYREQGIPTAPVTGGINSPGRAKRLDREAMVEANRAGDKYGRSLLDRMLGRNKG
jgi:hypothetical protein